MHNSIATHHHVAAIIDSILAIFSHFGGKFNELFLISRHKYIKLLLTYQNNRLLLRIRSCFRLSACIFARLKKAGKGYRYYPGYGYNFHNYFLEYPVLTSYFTKEAFPTNKISF